ncbi:Na+-bile acid cotransporter [Handroanthus impetiginosus]|uniref:Na+-bile acid cotransporter n=1 Tax=Handroanthus impetiginosus TaxID=429701 RepID=A0A2G9GC06_9LAMI|nr:Na+-bile acid cotransporter [Handroanthus impetiginosus]
MERKIVDTTRADCRIRSSPTELRRHEILWKTKAPISTAAPPQRPILQLSPVPFPRLKLENLHLRSPIFAASPTSRLSSNPRFKPLLCSNSSDVVTKSKKSWIEAVSAVIASAFPVWVALGCFLGLAKPTSFNWVQPKWTVTGITITMLGMGMTLTFDDLRGALAMPKEICSGFVLQYSVMPFSGYFVSKLLNLPSYYAAGLILVGCCPEGTASNIVTCFARGNMALSVLMPAASTVSAVFMTPFLTAKLAGCSRSLHVNFAAGAFLDQYFQILVKFVCPLIPPIALATVAILFGNAIAQSSSAILMSGRLVVLAVALLHTSGFFFGYVLSRMLGNDVSSSRTISIEVGMQNLVLGVVLATQHFGNPLTVVPCAVSSVSLLSLPAPWLESGDEAALMKLKT